MYRALLGFKIYIYLEVCGCMYSPMHISKINGCDKKRYVVHTMISIPIASLNRPPVTSTRERRAWTTSISSPNTARTIEPDNQKKLVDAYLLSAVLSESIRCSPASEILHSSATTSVHAFAYRWRGRLLIHFDCRLYKIPYTLICS